MRASKIHNSGCNSGTRKVLERLTLLQLTPRKSLTLTKFSLQTLDYYDRLLQDLAQITHAPSAHSLADVVQFVADFSDRQPRILARSRLFLHLFPEAFLVLGRDSLTEMVLDAVNLPQGAVRKDPGVLAFAVKAARVGWLKYSPGFFFSRCKRVCL